MKKIIKAESKNCEICGHEFHSYQIRPIKAGHLIKDACPICNENSNAYNEFKASLAILQELTKNGQLNDESDPNAAGPNISIEPIDGNIQAACELLKRMDGNYFNGISKIVAGTEANYGHTSSSEPSVLHINLGRISSENNTTKRDIIVNLAITISHEAAHSKSFKDGQFVGGESPALAEEQKVSSWIKANENRLQDLFK